MPPPKQPDSVARTVIASRSTNRSSPWMYRQGRHEDDAVSISGMLDPKAFKAYDVRIYPADLDEDGARAIGRAYVQQFEPARIAVGRDMRLSSPRWRSADRRGSRRWGRGDRHRPVGTEMVYLAVGHLGLDGGIQVTASHNPKEYTGMKIVRRGALPVGGDSGLLEIRDRALAGFDTSGGQTLDGSPRRMSFRPTSTRSPSSTPRR